MRRHIKILFIILTFSYYGVAQTDSLKFKISTNYLDGKSYLTLTKTIANPKSKIDVYFYKNHFALLYALPKDLRKRRFKNKKITKWALDKQPKNRENNWTDTYIYDDQGRLIEYRYSGCQICSSFPGGFKLTYNEKGDIIQRQDFLITLNPKGNGKWIKSDSMYIDDILNTLKLTYDDQRNIIKAEEFYRGSLHQLIELIQ